MESGATHLWANTILFAAHPLQTSNRVIKYQDDVKVIGQPPLLVEQYDDKDLVNNLLRKAGGFDMPQAWTIHKQSALEQHLETLSLPFPVVAKPLRGRGSQGVKVCNSLQELTTHADELFIDSSTVMIEEFLRGKEATVTVMPPSEDHSSYWALPVVHRFNHMDGVAPYNGIIAVTANSKAITGEAALDSKLIEAVKQCERAASLLGTTAPIRIDIRQYENSPDSKYALFDVNMKPVRAETLSPISILSGSLTKPQNMTGPGRPGREDQASLTLIAAEALGWDYTKLLQEILKTALPLRVLREKQGLLKLTEES